MIACSKTSKWYECSVILFYLSSPVEATELESQETAEARWKYANVDCQSDNPFVFENYFSPINILALNFPSNVQSMFRFSQ